MFKQENIVFLKLQFTFRHTKGIKRRRKQGISKRKVPWLVWLSGLSAGLHTKGSQIQVPGRDHGWVVGQVPGWGHVRGNHALMFLSLSFSPLSLKIGKIFEKRKREREREKSVLNWPRAFFLIKGGHVQVLAESQLMTLPL